MLGRSEKLRLLARTPKQINWVFAQLDAAPEFAFDIETSHATANEMEYHIQRTEAKVLGISFSWAENRGAYIPVYRNGKGDQYFKDPVVHQLLVDKLKHILEKRGVDKIAQNGKFDCFYLYTNFGIVVQDFVFDTMVAHWIIDENGEGENWAGVRVGVGHGLDKMAVEYMGDDALCNKSYDVLKQELEIRDPKYKRYETLPLELLGGYGADDAIDTLRLKLRMARILEERGQSDFFLNHEMAKTNVLIRAEIEGLPVKTDKIGEVITYLDQKLLEVREDLIRDVGFDFDPAHPENTAYVLFDVLGLAPQGERGKGGQFSTAKKILERFAKLDQKIDNPPPEVAVPRKIIQYRNHSRMKTNYAEAMHQYIDYKRRIFHMNYRQTGTDTGRLSAGLIHSMPSEAKGGKLVKSLFWAGGKAGFEARFAAAVTDAERDDILQKSGNRMIFSDFSQIELRVMAELSGDPSMIAAFMAGEDIHTAAAKRILGVTDAWIKDPANKAAFAEIRRRAKTINFGILFGEGPAKISEDLGFAAEIERDFIKRGKNITKEQAHKKGIDQAKELIESYFRAFPNVKTKIEATYREAEQTGVIRNMFGRIRHLEDIKHLAAIEMPRYKTLMLTDDEQKLYYGRQFGTGKPPSCYLGEDGSTYPPTLSGHLGYNMEALVAGRRPPKGNDIRQKLLASSHGYHFSKCASCPYLAPCAWEGEQSRRRMKLQRMRRQAFSSLIQGTAVDQSIYAWVRINSRIEREKIPAHGTRAGLAYIPIQVHDSLGVIVAASHADQMRKIVVEEMERWPNEDYPNWKTPIRVDASEAITSWDMEK